MASPGMEQHAAHNRNRYPGGSHAVCCVCMGTCVYCHVCVLARTWHAHVLEAASRYMVSLHEGVKMSG